MSAPRSSQRGFTLIEVMCATAVLTLGMIGVYSAEQTSFSTYSSARQLFVATNLASNVLEAAKVMPRNKLIAAASGQLVMNFDVQGQPVQNGGRPYYRTQLLLAPTVFLGNPTVTAKVTWQSTPNSTATSSFQMSAGF